MPPLLDTASDLRAQQSRGVVASFFSATRFSFRRPDFLFGDQDFFSATKIFFRYTETTQPETTTMMEGASNSESLPSDSLPKQAPPSEFKSAGIIPFDSNGVWLARMKKGLADFGGKRHGSQESAWETARREMQEEGGSRFESFDAFTYHPEGGGKHVVFYVRCNETPTVQADDAVTGVTFVEWKALHDSAACNAKWAGWLEEQLHPRLKYDKGGLIKKALLSFGKGAATMQGLMHASRG